MKITTYVKRHYAKLPKSTFDSEECVIVKTVRNDDYGYGHHTYEGIGVDSNGNVLWCFSSGCSCGGSCGTEHKPTTKVFNIDGESFNIDKLTHKDVDFESNKVEFTSY